MPNVVYEWSQFLMNNTLVASFNPLKILGDTTDTYAAELMRQQVKEIIGSYHHQFDHLYECVQNAVDACERAFVTFGASPDGADYVPMVKITVNLENNSIKVIDNGLGMANEIVTKYFFTPYATMKSGLANMRESPTRQRGEKGVGATFVAYGSNCLSLTTLDKTSGELTAGELNNALLWCNGAKPLLPMPEVQPCIPDQDVMNAGHGSAVEIRFSEETNIATLSDHGATWKQWQEILRLYTAIGYVDFNGQDTFLKSLQSSLILINSDGQSEAKKLETGYLYPHMITASSLRLSEIVRERGQVSPAQTDMNVLWEQFSTVQITEYVTRRIDNIKNLPHKKREQYAEILKTYKPEAYLAFVSSVEFWEAENEKIWGAQIEGQLSYGLIFATKSQKIGEQKRIDFKFRSGDFNRFFILLNMQNLKADIGRKSLREEFGDFGNFFANSVHDIFTDEDDCLTPNTSQFDETQEAELEAIKDEAFARNDLSLSNLNLTKVPREEQDVIALFFDLLGAGKIRGYEIYSTHVSRTYDGVGRFNLSNKPENKYDPDTNRLGVAPIKFAKGDVKSQNRCFLEFKFTTDGLVTDYRSDRKRLQDIKWLICWEIGSKHKDEKIGLYEITEPAFINQRDFYGVTHIMSENQNKVYVICLKRVLELLA